MKKFLEGFEKRAKYMGTVVGLGSKASALTSQARSSAGAAIKKGLGEGMQKGMRAAKVPSPTSAIKGASSLKI